MARKLSAQIRVVATDDDTAIASLPPLDAVADTVGGRTAEKLIAKVKPGGVYATVLKAPDTAAEYPSVRVVAVFSKFDRATLEFMAEAVRDGKLLIPISLKLPLSEAAEAQAAAEKGGVGKILLVCLDITLRTEDTKGKSEMSKESQLSTNSVQIEQKSYEMPPREGISIAQFLTVADIERSARYYEKVFGARILSLGDGNAPGYLQLANIWMILNVGGGPTADKPTVTLSVPDPNHINSFMNFRVADIQACYELWTSRGAEFITGPIPKYGEIRCYIRDPDGYIIEVGQSTELKYG
jgi:catechol 2,3-dioxygenase-like lactoylglutathione lyase family enzyme